MSKNKNCAELVDTMNYRIAIGFLVVSVAYAFEVADFVVGDSIKYYVDWAGKITGVIAMLIILIALWPVLSKKISKAQTKSHEAESFITDALHTSIRASWLVVMLALMVIMVMDNLRARLDLPADFYFKLLFFVMMFTVGLVFLIQTRDESDVGGDSADY